MRNLATFRNTSFGMMVLFLVCKRAAAATSFREFIEEIPVNVTLVFGTIILSVVWLGCTYVITNKHQNAMQYMQRQLDELWLLQEKPNVWPKPGGEIPVTYAPAKKPTEHAEGKLEKPNDVLESSF
ncbi:uncharacterized protein LOC117582979 [Drosophila guanche]|uniref:Uncharacterized protein n=1 Tax=Drosophila guanche TaxID=7266 RepID=A0A3B0JKK3_DROGU|nr:uncharacterized protein LOC117582979 [Drosophila guanche]SPP80852.1 Hypothetical predicted protein [Drosophila guanche]